MQQPANDNRPAEFDRQIEAAYPRLLARARRFTPDYYTLANDTAVAALSRWSSFRQTPGKPYYGFYTWLCWVMRGIASDYTGRLRRRVSTVSADAVDNPPEIAIGGGQEASVELSSVLSLLSPRERDILLRKAAGYNGPELASIIGVSRQRISQIEDEARAKILAADNDNVRVAA